jgi:hypothetical protein
MTVFIESFLRAGLQIFVGWLIAKGIVDAESASAFVDAAVAFGGAIVLGIGSLIWSIISKKKALDTPPVVK